MRAVLQQLLARTSSVLAEPLTGFAGCSANFAKVCTLCSVLDRHVVLKAQLHSGLPACPDVDKRSWLRPVHAPVCWHMALHITATAAGNWQLTPGQAVLLISLGVCTAGTV